MRQFKKSKVIAIGLFSGLMLALSANPAKAADVRIGIGFDLGGHHSYHRAPVVTYRHYDDHDRHYRKKQWKHYKKHWKHHGRHDRHYGKRAYYKHRDYDRHYDKRAYYKYRDYDRHDGYHGYRH